MEQLKYVEIIEEVMLPYAEEEMSYKKIFLTVKLLETNEKMCKEFR